MSDRPKTVSEIHNDLVAYLDGDECVDPIGYLETLQLELQAAELGVSPGDDGRSTPERQDERAKWTKDLASMFRGFYEDPDYPAYLIAADFLHPAEEDGTAPDRKHGLAAPTSPPEPEESTADLIAASSLGAALDALSVSVEPVPSTPRVPGSTERPEGLSAVQYGYRYRAEGRAWTRTWKCKDRDEAESLVAHVRGEGAADAEVMTRIVESWRPLTGVGPTPRVWAMPEIPEDVQVVEDRDGNEWHRVDLEIIPGRHWCAETLGSGYGAVKLEGLLLAEHEPLADVAEFDYHIREPAEVEETNDAD